LIWNGRGFSLDLTKHVAVMGIVNVTPDSFSDGGRYSSTTQAIEHGLTLATEGADVLDIGGESSRPGAESVLLDEELKRVVPVIEELRRHTTVPISIDTAKPEVARQALAAGANIINDITALADPAMARVIGEIRPGLVLMHMQGEPRTMQQNPHYENLIEEVNDFLAAAASRALAAGATAENIVIDPGIGFGKTWEHNLQLIRETKRFTELGYPVLIGPSRKRFIGELTGKDVDRRLYGSIGAVAAAVVLGARLVRVHDVAPMIDAVRVAEAIVGMDE